MNPTTNTHYDVIVIGSGIGGATSAILLARYFQKRVLLLEKHWQFGGLTHEFQFDGKKFATGLHYVGSVNDESVPDKLFDIITGGKASWLPMPYRYDHIILPDFSYALPSSPEHLMSELSERFPEETASINQYFRDIRKAFRFLSISNTLKSFAPRFLGGLIPGLGRLLGFNPNSSLQNYLDKRFKNPILKKLLAAQWCDYGVLPEESSFLVHAMITGHYLNGAFYPKGGPSALSNGMKSTLEQYGGTFFLRTPVTDILTRGDRAYGVAVLTPEGDRKEFTATHIISNTGAVHTYQKLLSHHHFDFLDKDTAWLLPEYDFFSVYLSLSESPSSLGFDGSNQWIYRSRDHSQNILPPDHPDFPGFYCLMFPSLKSRDTHNHTVEILTMVSTDTFRGWENSSWKQRGPGYYELKRLITERILKDVESRYPGFRDLIQDYDSSSSLTTQTFLSRERGSSYGVPFSTKRPKMTWLSNRTVFKNLYLSGQDAFGPGIMAAMMGGVGAAAKVLGPFGYLRIMRNVTKHSISRTNTSNQIQLTVRSITRESDHAYTIRCESHPELTYQAGQFLVISVSVGDQEYKRSYSLSSAPDDSCVSFTIKRIPGGVISNYLWEHLKPGDLLQVSRAKGSFVIGKKDRGKDVLLVAAGSGITPIYSLLADTLANQVGNRIHLIYATQSPDQAIFKDRLQQLSQDYPSDLKVSYFFSMVDTPHRPAGRLTSEELLAIVGQYDPEKVLVYACAPGSLVKMVRDTLDSTGFPEAHFRYESFSAVDLVQKDADQTGSASEVTFLTKHTKYVSQVAAGETVLTALRRDRVSIDHSCMMGECEICKCQLVEGEVATEKGGNMIVHTPPSTILPCISYSRSDKLVLEQ